MAESRIISGKEEAKSKKRAQSASDKVYYKKNKDKIIIKSKVYRHELRLFALQYYGGKCACCGESRWQFLALDHINGGGNEHRRKISGGNKNFCGYPFLLWLKRNNWPEGFRVLCNNCNMAIAFYGVCPHQEVSNVGK